MNDFVEAIKNNSGSDGADEEKTSSTERYNKLKKEEADVERGTPAEKRYQELKEKAKKEMIEEEMSPDKGQEEEDEDEEEFITH
ncbi:MAG: hypothetical protein ABEK10_03845 [Candidatus Nanosalina sp.]